MKNSQRLNDENLKVWLIISSDGSVSSAHCTCIAGLDEVCNHSAAILFALNSRSLAKEETVSCNEKIALCPIPKARKKVKRSKVSERNWERQFKQKGKKLILLLMLKTYKLRICSMFLIVFYSYS